MKKICSVLLILCMLALTLTACGGGVDPEFKATMDSYEEFFTEYCEFMKKYKENPMDASLITDYANYMTEYAEMSGDLASLNVADMSEADAKYYQEVQERINAMLLEIQ